MSPSTSVGSVLAVEASPRAGEIPPARASSAWKSLRQDWRWVLGVLLVASVPLAPLAALAYFALTADLNVWPHLIANVLPAALRDTLALLVGVGLLVSLLGVTTAWLVSAYTFPGRRIFEWALLLPLAMPAYIIAYTYVEILDAFGPVQTMLRAVTGFTSRQDYWFPEPRSLPGAILLMGFVLYPYVYLSARAMFLMQAAGLIDVARTLGDDSRGVFWRIALPLARPAIAVGVSLALMEAMNDIGAVEYLGVRTLTVSVYTTWINRGSLGGAAQIACLSLLIMVGLVALERHARRRQRFAAHAQRQRRLVPQPLKGRAVIGAVIACSLPILIGFVAPAAFLLEAAIHHATRQGMPPGFLTALGHTVMLASVAAAIAVFFGLVLAVATRVSRVPGITLLARLANLGYAAPGTILAVGMLAPLAAFDNAVDAFMRATFGVSTGLLLSGTGVALVLAYVARFLGIANGGLEAGLGRVPLSLDMAARNLGDTRSQTMWRIHLPLIRPALGAAALLVFVDAMKELPATLLLRPFNFETLSTVVYDAASRGMFEDGALAALAIVLAGLLPVVMISRLSRPLGLTGSGAG
ncbi:MAG: ABC transporter permease [Labrys sp. (in: a-proteobacteria)]|jgi:iron(III) transport system permease protein